MATTTPDSDHENANGEHSIRRYQGRHDPPIVSGESCFASPSGEESQEDSQGFEDTAGNGHLDDQISSWVAVKHLSNCLGCR